MGGALPRPGPKRPRTLQHNCHHHGTSDRRAREWWGSQNTIFRCHRTGVVTFDLTGGTVEAILATHLSTSMRAHHLDFGVLIDRADLPRRAPPGFFLTFYLKTISCLIILFFEKGAFKMMIFRYMGALLALVIMSSQAHATEAVKITNHKHDGMDIVAGDSNANKAYNQKGNDRPNAIWEFIPVSGQPDYYYICDWKHEECLVAGDVYDGNIYHQKHNNRDNAKWLKKRSQSAMANGFRSHFTFTDKKHGKELIAGDGYDGNLYHQNHNNRKNAIWRTSNAGEFGYLRSHSYTNHPALGVAKTKSGMDTLTVWNPKKMLRRDNGAYEFMNDGFRGCLVDQGIGGPAVFGVTPAGYWISPADRKILQNQKGITWGECTGANNQKFVLADWNAGRSRNNLKSRNGNYLKLLFVQDLYPQNVVVSHPSKPEQGTNGGASKVEEALGFWWDPNFTPK